MNKNYEILAPAGSAEQLKAAVNNGCDSVYLGLDQFNARMKSDNFSADNLGEWVDYCHFFGVKVYVAVNTSVKNSEFSDALKMIDVAYSNYADGVIVTDLALMKYAASLPKPFEIVASTQLNVHDKYGAEFVKACGATTVVCARECSFDDIEEVSKVSIKTECFIHGAECVCQSGQCLFSSMVGGNSGNRGLCAQPCRKEYAANGGEYRYLLSARDMCGLDAAKRLADAGASVFKIEGRGRRAEYAGAASDVYGRLFANGFKYTAEDKLLLSEMFNRHMGTPNYLYGRNDGIIYPLQQNHVGVTVGRVKGRGIVADTRVTKGDGFKIFDNNTEVSSCVALESGAGFISAEFANNRYQDGMTVCRTTSVELCDKILNTRRKRNLRMELDAKSGERVRVRAESQGISVELFSEFYVEKARNAPLTRSEIVKQLQKIGETLYNITDIVVNIDDIFIAKSQINALRRDVLGRLTRKIIESYNLSLGARNNRSKFDFPEINKNNEPTLAVVCGNERELSSLPSEVDYAILKSEFIDVQTVETAIEFGAYIDLPSFADLNYFAQLIRNRKAGIVCHNVGQVEFARRFGLKYIAGSGLNIFNDCIADVFCDADSFVYSQELTLGEIAAFRNASGLVFVDGEIILMKLVHCPYKVSASSSCEKCNCDNNLRYKDRMGNEFIIKRRRDSRCTFDLINGKKLSVAGKLLSAGNYVVDYDKAVVEHYLKLNRGVCDGYCETRPYTKGRLYSRIL